MSGYNWLLSATVLPPKLLNFQHCDWLLFATHAAYDSSKIKKHKGDLKKGKIATKLTKYALSLSLAKDKMPALLAVKFSYILSREVFCSYRFSFQVYSTAKTIHVWSLYRILVILMLSICPRRILSISERVNPPKSFLQNTFFFLFKT